MGDLTSLPSLISARRLMMAGVAFLVGALDRHARPSRRRPGGHDGAVSSRRRLALVTFDPYLSSRPLADALQREPEGQLIIDGAYYPFSSVVFYAKRSALLWNGRFNNLEYGLWHRGHRRFLLTMLNL